MLKRTYSVLYLVVNRYKCMFEEKRLKECMDDETEHHKHA